MRIGCSPAYVFAHFGEKLSYDNLIWSINKIAELGFAGLELETYNKDQMDIFTDEHIKEIKDLFLSLRLESSQFIGHSIKAEIASIDDKQRKIGIEELKRLVEICKKLGIIEVFNIPSSSPPELIVEYTETYPGAIQPIIAMPGNISWDKIWETHIETIAQCLDIIEKAGMKLAIEAVPFGVISNSDSFLRLAASINSDKLGLNLDTGHIFFQKEDLPVMIEKAGEKIFGTHICDNDGSIDDHWALGEGKIDWTGVLKAFKKIGYQGSLDIEINVAENPDDVYMESKKYLERILGKL